MLQGLKEESHVCVTRKMLSAPSSGFRECHKALGGWQSHVTEGTHLSPLPYSHWPFPRSMSCPFFCHRRSRPLPEAHHPLWWRGMTEQWIWLFPPASCSGTQGQCRRFPVSSRPELQQRVDLRTRSQNDLCLFCGHPLLLGRAPLNRAERKRMKQPNNFCACHQPLKSNRNSKAAHGKLLKWPCTELSKLKSCPTPIWRRELLATPTVSWPGSCDIQCGL